MRDQSNDRAHISEFRERGAKSLEEQRRDPDDEDDLKLAVARERKMWMSERLTKLGMERSQHWGWTNTYTYTKSLGEQIILSDTAVTSTIVRPAVVESAIRYPFPGWNEGFNTTAPLMYLMLKGHRNVPVGTDHALDIIPVDFITAGMWLATAAILAGEHEPVYQLGTSDENRVTSRRVTELMQREIQLLTMQQEISSQARGEIDRSQREYFLRQQLRAIQQELGEENELAEEIARYRQLAGIALTVTCSTPVGATAFTPAGPAPPPTRSTRSAALRNSLWTTARLMSVLSMVMMPMPAV